MFGLNYAILMMTLLRLSIHIEILIICNIRLFLRNLVNHQMTTLLDLIPLSVAYVLVDLLLFLTMSVLNTGIEIVLGCMRR
jgi:hypothetical protein